MKSVRKAFPFPSTFKVSIGQCHAHVHSVDVSMFRKRMLIFDSISKLPSN